MVRQLLIDTGPLLVWTFGGFEGGHYLEKACDFLRERERRAQVAREIAENLQTFLRNIQTIYVTPQIFAEFGYMSSKILGQELVGRFFRANLGLFQKIEELSVSKNELLRKLEILKFGISDMSLIVAS